MKKDRLLLTNARVITMDPALPRAVAVETRGRKINSVIAHSSGLIKSAGTEVIDCKGKTILPGFIDAHCHFIGLAERLVLPDISSQSISSIADMQAFIREVAGATPPGTWIYILGYQQFNLKDKRHPDRWDLDKATTAHPICLSHVTGYIHILNSLALNMVKIDNFTEAPPNGLIDRDLTRGEPNGILFNMRSYLSQFIPHIDDGLLSRGIKLASKRYISHGITSLQDASLTNSLKRLELFRKYIESGSIRPRVIMIMGMEPFVNGEYEKVPAGDDYLRVNGVKIILSEASGELKPSIQELEKIVLRIQQEGKQAVIHAIEEHVIRIAANVIAVASQSHPRTDPRHRIEHCSLCQPETAKFLAMLGITVVTQPNFIYYNGDRYLQTIPEEERRYLYPFKTLREAGLVVAASSDSPVVPESPLHGIYGAVTRKTERGNRLEHREKISVMQALKMYTVDAARSAFEENIKGSIAPGKLADLIVLNEDPTKVAPQEIKDLQVEMVIIGGEIVYQKGV